MRLEVSQGHQTGTIRYVRYGFLLVFYSNIVLSSFPWNFVTTLGLKKNGMTPLPPHILKVMFSFSGHFLTTV